VRAEDTILVVDDNLDEALGRLLSLRYRVVAARPHSGRLRCARAGGRVESIL